MKHNILEFIVGIVVVIISVVFGFILYFNDDHHSNNTGYIIYANFYDTGNIQKDSDVRISGVNVGNVNKIILDQKYYYATLTMNIDQNVKIPIDSEIIISMDGILGKKYLRINPGSSDTYIQSGEKLRLTKSALNFEDLISKVLYSITSK